MVAGALIGCGSHGDEGSVVKEAPGMAGLPGDGAVVRAERAQAISGGTLLVTKDGRTAIAADPDRDRVYLVDLSSDRSTEVFLRQGDAPGRVMEDASGRIFVVLRGGGSVVQIDREAASVVARVPVCATPRGIALDATRGNVLVACETGELVSLDATTLGETRRVRIGQDLRDVIVTGENVYVSTFRSAELIRIGEAGQVLRRTRPSDQLANARFKAAVGWRTVATASGEVVMLHQMVQTDGVSVQPGGYSSSSSGGCGEGIVRNTVTTLEPTAAEGTRGRVMLPMIAGASDVAVSVTGDRVAVVSASNSWSPEPVANVFVFVKPEPATSPGQQGQPSANPCGPVMEMAQNAVGEPVSVAFDASGNVLVQSRQPATLQRIGGGTITLSTEDRADTGLALFHKNSGSGVACASCHPEGTDDGQVWSFHALGARRTQYLAGGLSGRAPFHWNGELPTMRDLMSEVFVSRMGSPMQPAQRQVQAMADWLDTVPATAQSPSNPQANPARGKELFEDQLVGCATCHSGPALTNNELVDVGTGGVFAVPSLVGIGVHPPFMHDGCAATLRGRFSACGGGDRHGVTSHLSASQIDDLVAYLETL
jgi:mono/diheme cytochrome c family protein